MTAIAPMLMADRGLAACLNSSWTMGNEADFRRPAHDPALQVVSDLAQRKREREHFLVTLGSNQQSPQSHLPTPRCRSCRPPQLPNDHRRALARVWNRSRLCRGDLWSRHRVGDLTNGNLQGGCPGHVANTSMECRGCQCDLLDVPRSSFGNVSFCSCAGGTRSRVRASLQPDATDTQSDDLAAALSGLAGKVMSIASKSAWQRTRPTIEAAPVSGGTVGRRLLHLGMEAARRCAVTASDAWRRRRSSRRTKAET